MLTIRLFVSSPGDVGEERLTAERVIERLRGEFGHAADLRPYLWEHEPLRATAGFQDQIVSPEDCDIVVCILWSRIGTRLPGNFRRSDGSTFSSGTEWEFETAAEAYRKKGAPDLLAYRKTAPLTTDLTDEQKLEDQRRQYRALEEFVTRWFEQDGAFKAAFKSFRSIEQFETVLETDLRKLIRERLLAHVGTVGEALPEVTWFSGSPFRGLETFDYEHRGVFFGRTRAIGAIKNALVAQAARGCAFVQVLGASGVGKSSLVRAGVIPTITQPGVIEGVGLWSWCVFRPGDAAGDVFDGLAAAMLLSATDPRLEFAGLDAQQLAAEFREAPQRGLLAIKAALARAADSVSQREHLAKPPETRLFIAIDQMEELFSLERISAADREKFVQLLSVLTRSGAVWAIATMRSDFYARCAEVPELVAMKAGGGQVDLEPPNFDEIGQMISWPARAAGLQFEHEPVSDSRLDAVIHEAASEAPEALPLLEFTLDELYKRRTDSGVLTFAAYRGLGGLEGALARRAEQEFSKLSADAQAALPGIFRSLVTIQESGEELVVSRRVPLAALESSDAGRAAFRSFVEARLLVTDRGSVALAHEALLRHWKRLEDWIEADREMLRTRARVAELATLWRNESKRRDMLLQPGRLLGAAEELLANRRGDLDESLAEFITASAAGRKRRERIRRLAVAGVSVVAVVMSVLAVIAYRNAQEARRESNLALARQLAAQAQLIEGQSPELLERAALLSIESARRARLVDNDLLLRRTDALLPHSILKKSFVERVVSISFDRDGHSLAVAAGNLATVVDAASGREISHLRFDDLVEQLAFSSDGRLVVAGADDRTARVFEASTGKEVCRFRHDGAVNAVAFSPDGRLIATGSFGPVHVFDVIGGRQVSADDQTNWVYAVAFSPDGRYVGAAGDDWTAQVFEPETGRAVLRIRCQGRARAIAFSPDSQYVAIGSADRIGRVFEIKSGRQVASFSTGGEILDLSFSPDGHYLVVGDADKTARVFDLASAGKEISRFALGGMIWSVRFDPTGHFVVAGSTDKTAREFEVLTGKEVMRLSHNGSVRSVRFDRDGHYLATASDDKSMRVFQAYVSPDTRVSTPGENPEAVTLSQNQRFMVTGSGPLAQVFDTTSGRQASSLNLGGRIWAVAFTPDARYAAAAGAAGSVTVFESATGQIVSRCPFNAWVYALAFSLDGKYLAAGGDDGTIRLFRVEDGKEAFSWSASAKVWALAFSPDGRFLLAGGNDGVARMFEVATAKEILRLKHNSPVLSVAFSADGLLLATGGDDGTARVFDRSEGQEVSHHSQSDSVTMIAFSPDGHYVATCSDDKSTRIFETTTGIERATIVGDGTSLDAEFDARGRSLSIVSSGSIQAPGAVISHNFLRSQDLIRDVCSRLTRNLTPSEWKQYFPLDPYKKTCR